MVRMERLRLMLPLLILAAVLCTARTLSGQPAQTSQEKRPNIVFILADDLGWTDLACYGSEYYETPNLDSLAAQGIRFTNGYTCGVNCAPTRSAIMSGQYTPRTGMYTVGNPDRFDWQTRPLRPAENVVALPLNVTTLAQTLKNSGYATAMFGKWHLGEDEKHHPSARGFDEAITSAGQHFDFRTNPETDYPDGTYLADFITEQSVNFIKSHKDDPFFLYVPHFGVHGPHQAKKELIEKFKQKPVPEGSGHHDPVYAAMIYSVDESVGRIMKSLEEQGVADNTLVIFSSDNGGVGGYVREGIKPEGKDVTDNAPLRGGKGMLYEGGVRVPFIWNWPGHIAPGTTSDEPIISVDLYPTFLAITGAQAPEGQVLDGLDLTPLLTASTGEPVTLDREALYWHLPTYLGAGPGKWRSLPGGAIRMGDFKLLEFFEDGRLELYNLKEDLGQTRNLAEEEPERAKTMHAKLVDWRESIGAKMPTKNTEQTDKPKKNRKRKKQPDADE